MVKAILICQCSGKEEKAKTAYDIIFPNTPVPQIIKGKEAIAQFESRHRNAHLKAVSKLNGNFAYYIDITESGKIIEEYDLTTGKRLA